MTLLVGLFVGGQSTRMGGVPKGLLRAPDSELSLVERLVLECRAALPGAQLVLVGEAAAYSALELPVVGDRPAGVGPLGGLLGLLTFASASAASQALVLACDLPRVSRTLLGRLAAEYPDAAVVSVQQAAVRNPLIARYAVGPALAAASAVLATGQRSLQLVLDRLQPSLLALSTSEEASLQDWDAPEDVR